MRTLRRIPFYPRRGRRRGEGQLVQIPGGEEKGEEKLNNFNSCQWKIQEKKARGMSLPTAPEWGGIKERGKEEFFQQVNRTFIFLIAGRGR